MNILDKYRIPTFSPDGETGSDAAASAAPEAGADVSSSEPGIETDASSSFEMPDGSLDDDDFVEATSDAGGAAETETVTGDTEKESQAAPEQQAAPTKEEPKQPAPAQQAQDGPQGESSDPADITSLIEGATKNRDALIKGLAQERFQLTSEEQEEFETDATSAISKFGARVYFDAVSSALNHINTQVPRLVSGFLQAQKVHQDNENAFYSRFPAISKEKHEKDVFQFANAFKAANPGISKDDLFAMIGAAVMARHGLSAAPAKPAEAATLKPAPFAPARPGVQVRATPETDNPFMGLGMELEE